ncbi:MAG: hypothetical protein F6K15_19045 [Okeania sp. SIO2B3]|nr:hypothetical protein [Okeania sp. SIO2B3]
MVSDSRTVDAIADRINLVSYGNLFEITVRLAIAYFNWIWVHSRKQNTVGVKPPASPSQEGKSGGKKEEGRERTGVEEESFLITNYPDMILIKIKLIYTIAIVHNYSTCADRKITHNQLHLYKDRLCIKISHQI